MYINVQQNRVSRSVKTVHTNLFANNRKLYNFATTNSNFEKKLFQTNIVICHRIMYMYIIFQQNQVGRSVKTVHTNIFANNRKFHICKKYEICNLQLKLKKKPRPSDMHHPLTDNSGRL